jgi:hypothetical protein
MAAPLIGPEPLFVYRPSRPYSAAERAAARARTHELAGEWATAPPAEDEDDAPPEPEPERPRRPRRERVPAVPVTLPPKPARWSRDVFEQTGVYPTRPPMGEG